MVEAGSCRINRSTHQQINASTALGGLNEGLNEGLNSLLNAIGSNEGIQAKGLPALLGNRPLKTIERQIAELIEMKLIERRGSRKTGGYYRVERSDR